MSDEAKERWKAKNIRGYPRFSDLPYVADADGAVVCRMSGGNCETVEARAVLIAAAPETAAERDRLFVEKEALLSALELLRNFECHEFQDEQEGIRVYGIVEAAIAEAKGETQ